MYFLLNGQLHCFQLGSVVLKMPLNILVCLLVNMHIYFSWCMYTLEWYCWVIGQVNVGGFGLF